MRRLVHLWGALGIAVALVGCGDDETTGGNGGAGGLGGSGAGGESGGGPPFGGCTDCGTLTPVCVDEASCEVSCPPGRATCDSLGAIDDGPWDICCEAGAQCCPGVNGSFCGVPGEGCPTACPDGSVCPDSEQCQLDPVSGAFSCVSDCPSDLDCGDQCCPFGSRCEAGACPLADLSIDVPYLEASAEVVQREFVDGSCSFAEGCVDALGVRKLLRFSLKTPNTGAGDLFLGQPFGNDLFEYSSCHDHYHFQGYAEYRILDTGGNPLAIGHKQAFCLLDYEALDGTSTPAQYDCSYQGISAGWSDIYESNLPCQWVDITDLPAGSYELEIRLNFEQTLAEESYANNTATIPITVEGDSCPNGCRPVDATCCAAGDPCGWAADGSCDCGGHYEWDVADCSACLPLPDGSCDLVTSCVGGCTLATDPCCDAANTCNLDGNDVCDCEGTQAWDDADCTSCYSADPNCAAVDTCPNGCAAASQQPGCCGNTDDCGYANDGWCDCNGNAPWDFADCSNCQSTEPDCPN